MSYCLDLTKFITGIGLVIDVIGIYVLLHNELRLRNIDNLKSRGADKSGLDYNKERREEGAKYPLSITNKEAMKAEDNHPPSKALRLSKRGLILVIIGFVIQILALFIDNCISID